MDQHFSKIGEVHTMLQEAKIGLWCVEYDNDKPPRLYADDTFLSMMGIAKSLSPEEGYRMWEEQIPSYEKERAAAYMNAIKKGEHSEIEYAWQHPERPISTVSKLAGHSSVDTTATFYINSSREEKLKAVNLL